MKTHRTSIETRQSLSTLPNRAAAAWTAAVLCRLSIALLALVLVLFGDAPAARASATPPDTMTYQGFLVDGNGNALAPTTPQNYPVIFRIYPVSSGGAASLWSEQQIVTVDKGNFSVLLGEGTPVGGEPRPALSSLFAGNTASDRYISVSVTISGTTTEILPRLRLVPSPYAFLATSASSLVQPNGSPFVSFDGGQVNVTGNLGIGTPAAGRRLQVGDANTANSEGMIRLASRSGTGGANRAWDIGVPETDETVTGIGYSFVIDDLQRAGTEFMVQWGSGNVGIGTANPTSLLQLGSVGSTGDAFLRMESIGGNQFANGIKLRNFNDEHGWDLINQERGGVGLQANGFHIVRHSSSAAGVTALFIDKFAGNVGIGTTAPANPLDIASSGTWRPLSVRGNGGSDMVVMGNLSGTASIGGHNGAGNAWANFSINPGGGNVGIGTATPGRRFHVSGNDTVMGRFDSSHAAGTWLSLGNSSAGGRFWQLISTGSGNGEGAGKLLIGHGAFDGQTSPRMTLQDNGAVGIGTSFPEDQLHLRGGVLRIDDGGGEYIRMYRSANGLVITGNGMGNPGQAGGFGTIQWDGDGNWDSFSDRRLKTDIADAEPVLGRLMQLPVRRYRWKDGEEDAPAKFGVIAQEVQPLFPESVGSLIPPGETNEMMTVKYGTFGLIAVKALQELKAEKDAERAAFRHEISELKQEVERLKGKAAQAARVDVLEQQMDDLKQVVQQLAAGRKQATTVAARIEEESPASPVAAVR